MEEIRATFVERIHRTKTVESFRFSLPKKIVFLAGQFLQIIFDENERANKELNKYLSLSCSPTKDYIEVTKRISDSLFSKRLMGLQKGDQVLMKIPMGHCVFLNEYNYIGFLIGGIGITPVISIIEYISDQKLGTNVHLFYSNRTDEDIAFKKELDCWMSMNKNIKVTYMVTDATPQVTTITFGPITKDVLLTNVCDLQERIWFIFGPPRMVEAMYALSLELKCRKENIKKELFIGY